MKSVHWQTALAGCWMAAATWGCAITWKPREDREAVPRQAATQGACREWTYRPALQSGGPVPCWVEAPVKYSLH